MNRFIALTIVLVLLVSVAVLFNSSDEDKDVRPTITPTPTILFKAHTKSPLEETIANMERSYIGVYDFKASFSMTSSGPAVEPVLSSGDLYVKKPGRMRWIHTDGHPTIISRELISDGSIAWLYTHTRKRKTAYKECAQKRWLTSAFDFVMENEPLSENFYVSFADDNPSNLKLRLVPKDAESVSYLEVILTLDSETFRVQKMKTTGVWGTVVETIFTNVEVNMDLPDSGFEFKVPNGAQVWNHKADCRP